VSSTEATNSSSGSGRASSGCVGAEKMATSAWNIVVVCKLYLLTTVLVLTGQFRVHLSLYTHVFHSLYVWGATMALFEGQPEAKGSPVYVLVVLLIVRLFLVQGHL